MDGFNKFCLCVLTLTLNAGLAFAGALSLEECKQQAAQGDSEAMYQLAERYENADGVRKDKFKALSNYRKAADKGHRKACERLAYLYENGILVAKDSVEAARYRAKAQGRSGEIAAVAAKAAEDRPRVDEIEVALDYILGRNGKSVDPKTGIRLLYQQAKDKPIAQRVFVERWERGDLDEGLSVIDSDEWALILPWFKAQFDKGRTKGGLVLGNDAYRRGAYEEAIAYWKSAGSAGIAKAWYRLGQLHMPGVSKESGGGPERLQDETKARIAYEKCLNMDDSWDTARYNLGLIYLFGKQGNANSVKAKDCFSRLLKKQPDDMWCLYHYGLSGVSIEEEALESRWTQARIKYLIEQQERSDRGYRLNPRDMDDLKRLSIQLDDLRRRKRPYVEYIQRAANKGCKPAVEFMKTWNSR